MLLTVSGLLVVLIGLRMWGVPFLRRISPELTRPCRFRGKAFAVGLLTGLWSASSGIPRRRRRRA